MSRNGSTGKCAIGFRKEWVTYSRGTDIWRSTERIKIAPLCYSHDEHVLVSLKWLLASQNISKDSQISVQLLHSLSLISGDVSCSRLLHSNVSTSIGYYCSTMFDIMFNTYFSHQLLASSKQEWKHTPPALCCFQVKVYLQSTICNTFTIAAARKSHKITIMVWLEQIWNSLKKHIRLG